MTFDNLTLAGVLFTLPYIAMLVMFSKNRRTSKQDEVPLFECLDDEPYRYGTGGGAKAQPEPGSCTACA